MNISSTLCRTYMCLAMLWPASYGMADSIIATSVATGYQVKSIELGQPFGGAIAVHPDNPRKLYVSYGNYSSHQIMELNADTGTTRTVTPIVGNVGGLAVLTNGDLAITDNYDFTNDTILRAHDGNGDGDFLDPGEVTELIAPILATDDNFTGAQMAVAPAGNAAQIPTGALLVQTADGNSDSEILVVENPEANPVYRPSSSAFYSGFTYNGGLAFTPEGHLLCGISEYPTGKITALVNQNGNDQIDSGESHVIVDGTVLVKSLSDITVTGDGKLVTSENSGTIRLFELPSDLLTGTATESTLVITNASYVSSVRADDPSAPFTSVSGSRATVYAGGFVSFPAATNLLAISPEPPASVGDWILY